ncbi:fungal Zn binuclear cluster domain containing protein [Colletotrichum tofieldiae]|nr:fungal Zn binuclear cluster domain containing protein [Colletotrichum tofieldiae]
MHILCSRCAERAQECSYEPVKPRQRKKRDSIAGFGSDTASQTSGSAIIRRYSAPDATMRRWKEECLDDEDDGLVEEAILEEPEDSGDPLVFDFKKMFAMHHNKDDVSLVSPVDSVAFDLSLEDADEEVVRRGSVQHNAMSHLAVTRTQRHPDLAMVAPVPVASPRLEFLFPTFSEFSERPNRRALVDHFTNVMSHLIVLRDTEAGNPFQQLVLPLCHSSSTVTNAIYALASAHLENRGCGHTEEKAVYFHNQAIQGLARLIELGGEANKNELLATIMLLVYYEVQNRSNIVDGHLKGAIAIMNGSSDNSNPTTAFLERAFRFYDVIAALSFGTAPLSTAPATGCLIPFPPLDSPTSSPLGSVDTLLGFSTTLWPIIHRLSNLLALKTELQAAIANGQTTKVAVLRSEFETTSDAIEHALKLWQPSFPPGFSPDTMDDVALDESELAAERARLHSILNNALAYRHSAFVYLYRSIYGYPRRHHLVQHHTHAALSHCAATVNHAGPMAALLWPLFVAACEAINPGDRALARQAFVAVERRQGMTNIQRAWTIAQEVWRRADMIDDHAAYEDHAFMMSTPSQRLGKGADLWRRVSEDMGVTIVFG